MCSGSYPAYFGEGTKLTVLEEGHNITAPKVNVFEPSKDECQKDKDNERKKTLVCLVSGFYPDHIIVSWLNNGEVVEAGVANDTQAEKKDNFYTYTSRLRVSEETWFNPQNEFTCNVRFFNGSHYENFKEAIQGEQAPKKGMTNEKYMKMEHKVKLSYAVLIVKSCVYGAFVVLLVWKLQGSKGK